MLEMIFQHFGKVTTARANTVQTYSKFAIAHYNMYIFSFSNGFIIALLLPYGDKVLCNYK